MPSIGPAVKSLLILCGSLVLLALGCTLTIPGTPPTPTALPVATPDGDTIYFSAPYSYLLTPDSRIPRTRIYYQGEQNGVFVFSIGGLSAFRQLNDLISWRGVIAPNVVGDYQLVIVSSTDSNLFTEGSVRLAIFNPSPLEIPLSSLPSAPPDFANIPVDYNVPEGRLVPGTTLLYQGQQDGMALLTGSSAYPLYPVGNSVTWTGRLTSNVLLRYDLVVSRIDENGVGLLGTAQLWILP